MKIDCAICHQQMEKSGYDVPLCAPCSNFFAWFDYKTSKYPLGTGDKVQVSYFPSLFIDYYSTSVERK